RPHLKSSHFLIGRSPADTDETNSPLKPRRRVSTGHDDFSFMNFPQLNLSSALNTRIISGRVIANPAPLRRAARLLTVVMCESFGLDAKMSRIFGAFRSNR